jgi:2-polyprenyl-3-methyl-5-hydroxy-6-metoxy-1,4-benzoquinol methylase
MYCIPNDYIINPVIHMMQNERQSLEFQTEVYRYAFLLSKKYRLESILDVGCGRAKKLEEYILPITSDITGIDCEDTIKRVSKEVSFGNWIAKEITKDTSIIKKDFDLIIVSDVIEHFEYPEYLLDYVKKQSHCSTYILFSTPDRRSLNNELGPPNNKKHVREWLFNEFVEFLESFEFNIIDSRLVPNDHKYNTIICLCKIK